MEPEISRKNIVWNMVELSEVEDKLPSGSFTARAKTDGIDIRQTVGLRQA